MDDIVRFYNLWKMTSHCKIFTLCKKRLKKNHSKLFK